MASSRARRKKILVLIDAHAVLHRAFHALPDFTSSSGQPTGALYGFISFVLKMIREIKPDYIAACYDLPQPTFRHAAYDKYKAGRPHTDEGLAAQIDYSKKILEPFGIPVFSSAGYEADDLLGVIANKIFPEGKEAKEKDFRIVIASGDLDTLQLVRKDYIVVYTLSRGVQESVVYNEKKVQERYGFGPKLIPDFKALKGDPSDNIIGVPGIGDKIATELIVNFGSIEEIYGNLKKDKAKFEEKGIKPRIIRLLEENEEAAYFSKSLAEINTSAPVEFSLEQARWKKNYDPQKAKTALLGFGFRSLADRLPVKEGEVAVASKELSYADFSGEIPEKLFFEIEKPLSRILADMQARGIMVDMEYLKNVSAEFHKKLESLERKIWELSGEEFNINSPQQLGKIIFEKLGIRNARVKKTSTGAYSTDINELVKLKGKHAIIDEIISYRELAKLVSTYIDALIELADSSGRVHTTFKQMGTSTGRISSQNPNLQNIPIRTDLGKSVRRAFVADKGCKLVAFDYSQIELRVMAILSGDEKLVKIFKEGKDVHSAVAAEVFNVSLEEVDENMRRQAKVINFGIIYGMGINALKQNLGCSREEAQIFYDEYFHDFKGVADYIEKIKSGARQKGYTETLFGRKRFFPEINSQIEYVRKESERMAVNAPVQGTAADFVKKAMVETTKVLEEKSVNRKACLLLQIHDELLYEAEEGVVAEIIPLIAGIMENIYKNKVPLKVKISTGLNWRDMVEFKQENL